MFVINFSLYFLSDLKTGTPEDKGANGTSVGRSEDQMVAITLEDAENSLNILGIHDGHLHSIIENNPPGTVVRVMQNCRMPKIPDRPDISNELEEREVAITERIRVLEIKESEIRRRERKGLQEERDLKERLQFLTDKVADLQQKLDKSCWDATEPERGIRDAEDDLFSLDD
ncbi:hypothetical protein MAJ_10545, partial [Metarhizium majus ARSEF 297]